MLLLTNGSRRKESATVAQVSYSDAAGFGAVSATEHRGMRVFAPRGVAYRPCEGDNLLLLPVEGQDACAGVLAWSEGLEGGELCLSSAGGARIYLKNNGEIVLNGLTITADGNIVPPK